MINRKKLSTKFLAVAVLVSSMLGLSINVQAVQMGDSNRVSYGSNYYYTSNIREWLNSNQTTVSYSCQKPDAAHTYDGAYDTEAGFLNGFASDEQASINPVTHSVLLADCDTAAKDGGTQGHIYTYSDPTTAVQNYDSSYYKNVTDKVFLLSIKDLSTYVEARGWDVRAYPAQTAVDDSNKYGFGASASSYWYYWLNTPYSTDSYGVRYVDSTGSVNYGNAYYGGYGVRPALYLKSGISTSKIANTANLNIGDDVTLGSYRGYPITWKVINKDSNGIEVFADKILTLKSFDANGDYSDSSTVSTANISVDTTPPTISLTAPLTWTNTSSENVTATITDTGSGVATQKWASGTQTTSYFTSGGTTFTGSTFPVTSNGTYTVYAVDNSGNAAVSTVTVSNFDTTPPTITATAPSTWTNASSENVTATITDTGSGVATQKWASGTQATSYFTSGGTTFTGSTFPVTSNGTYTVYAVDNSGNAAVSTVTVSNFDTTPPTIGLSAGTIDNTGAIVNISEADSSSGIYQNRYIDNGVVVQDWTSAANSFKFTNLGGNVQHTFEVDTKDNAGSTASATITEWSAPDAQTISYSNVTGTTADISVADDNSSSTLYCVKVTDGSGLVFYADSNGNIQNTIQYITLPTKSMTLKGLQQGTQYNVIVTAYDSTKTLSSPSNTLTFTTIADIPPTISSFSITPSTSYLTVQVSSADTNLADQPYKYVLGNFDSGWVSQNYYTFSNLTPNTNYTVTYYVKNKSGTTIQQTTSLYTLADKPFLNITNVAARSFMLSLTDNNPSTTLYSIKVTTSSGTEYDLNQNLTSYSTSETYITLPSKQSYIPNLNPNSTYTIKVTAKNGDGAVTTSNSNSVTTKSLNITITPSPGMGNGIYGK